MNTHQFTLIVEGPDLQDPDNLDALFLAGCDDATAGRIGDVQYLDFDREAAGGFGEAATSAVRDVESAIPGARVIQLEPDDLVTMVEIAQRTGRTRQSIDLLVRGERGPGGFPVPATHFRERQRMWRWLEVASWFYDTFGEPHRVEDPGRWQFTSLFNAGLTWRRFEDDLPSEERERIRQAIGREPA